MEKDKTESVDKKKKKTEAAAPEESGETTEKEAENKELNELRDKYLRLAAEYDNFRKRSARERDAVYSDATVAAVKLFLPVLDNLDRAIASSPEDKNLLKGVEMTRKQFFGAFEKLGVEEIEAEGEEFDPNLHNAVLHIEDEKIAEQTVVEVLEKGYTMNGKVIRVATVKVAN